MDIQLDDIGKRYRYEWIFRNLSFDFKSLRSYAILGPNGSGKSTLMKILSGHLSPSTGKIRFSENGKTIDLDDLYRHISYAAPYIDLIEEFGLREAIDFHSRFKPLANKLKTADLIDLLGFEKSAEKEIRFFSSGMKQRLKLALAICTDTPLLLLDEPTTNLDTQGTSWYRQLIDQYTSDRLVIVASNVEADYDFCAEKIEVTEWKGKRVEKK